MLLTDERGHEAEKMSLALMKKDEDARRARMSCLQCHDCRSNENWRVGRRNSFSAILKQI